jgi:hypothetical protein
MQLLMAEGHPVCLWGCPLEGLPPKIFIITVFIDIYTHIFHIVVAAHAAPYGRGPPGMPMGMPPRGQAPGMGPPGMPGMMPPPPGIYTPIAPLSHSYYTPITPLLYHYYILIIPLLHPN